MKKFISFVCFAGLTASLGCAGLSAQTVKRNNSADSIVGEYLVVEKTGDSKVRFTKNADGTFDCSVFWVRDSLVNGVMACDVKNPDKSLRSTPCNKIVLIKGLKYNAAKKQWDGTKIYDPNRGIKANMTASFTDDNTLMIYGSVMGIGEKVYWDKIR